MPSFLARGLARYFAASVMASSSSSSSLSNNSDPDYTTPDITKGVSAWNDNMRWLIPFVQATGYRIEIENPKSHEKIVIDKETKKFPRLTSSWLRRYDRKELATWMEQEKKKEKAYKKAEARGRAKFGNSYMPTDQDIRDAQKR